MAKVIGPGIVAHRRAAQENVWSWVLKVNKELNTQRVETDDSITVTLPDDMSMTIFDEMLVIYEDEGWTTSYEVVGNEIQVKFMP